MSCARLDSLKSFSEVIGMVLTDEEKQDITDADIEAFFKKFSVPTCGVDFCKDRLFGFIAWGDHRFYD